MLKSYLPTLCFTTALLVSCGVVDDSPNDPPETLSIDGKGDISGGISSRGELNFAGEVSGEFLKDFDIHAYTISAKRGSEIRIDVTHKGTSRTLDTNMFLYAPTEDGLVRIAKDDDSGYGEHSRIDIELLKDAEFLLVIKAEDDEARGKYRIALECKSGDCAFEPASVISADCPERLVDIVVECVVEQHLENREGFPDFERLLDGCTKNEEVVTFHHEDICQEGDDAWCFEDFHTFFLDKMMPNCRIEAAQEYELDLPVELTHTDEFSPRPMTFDDCEACTININSMRYTGTPAEHDIGQSATAFTSWPLGVFVENSGITGFREEMGDMLSEHYQADLRFEIGEHIDAINIGVGPIESATRIEGFGALDEEAIFAWALHIPSENRVVLFEVVDDAF